MGSISGSVRNQTKVTRQSARAFTAIIALLFTLAVIALVSIAREQNLLEAENSKIDVERSLKANLRIAATAIKDYSFWNEAYQHAGREQVDRDWAFTRNNIGSGLYSIYSLEGVFIVGSAQDTRYAVVNGELSTITASQYITGDLTKLIKLAQKKAADNETIYGYYLVNGQPALVYAAVIKPTEETDETALSQMSVMLFVDVLDISALGKTFGIKNLYIDVYVDRPGKAPFLLLQSETGMKLRLHWTPEQPGDAFLYALLPLLIAIGLMFGVLVWFMERRMVRAALAFDASQEALLRSEQRFRSVTEASSDWIWETNREGKLVFLSDRFTVMTGFDSADWLGKNLCHLVNVDKETFQRLASTDGNAAVIRHQTECSYQDAQSRSRHCRLSVREVIEHKVPIGYQGTVNDITEEVEAKRRIKHMSQHDALTGLANRIHLKSYLETRLTNRNEWFYILSIDLDRFKPINDTLGHAAGDRVLCEVADRLRQCVREGDLVARLGGDEFVMVINHLPIGYDIEKLCSRVCDSVNQPMFHGQHELSVGVSIGVVVAPVDGHQPGDLLKYADIALYEAKAAGRNTWQRYVSEMNERVLERRQIELDLKNALRKSEFFLEFQPRFAVDGPVLSGAEALVRWNHPTRGRLAPDQFISIAEETGLIVTLSDWVLKNACEAALGLDDRLIISVNLSPVEFQRGDLVGRIRNVLETTGLTPARLELEITETVLLDDSTSALLIMNELKRLGVRLSMDDFGTGYSSLSYLRTYPFDGIKIDRSFIADLHGDTRDTGIAIIESIIGLGRALTMTVTAEGVETHSQLNDLRTVNCDEVQGYLLGHPLSLHALKDLCPLTDRIEI
jgi:diguanylate cyclase (GGDEF)-like protein/PAS domain S-box-containing protein